MRAKDLIDLWIRHLLFQLVKPKSHPGFSSLFTRDKKEPFARYQLSPLDNAEPILTELLEVYWEGLQRCIYFLPESSFAYGQEVFSRGGNERSALKKASYEWERNYGSYRGEIGDPYNKLILGTENPLKFDQFKENAALFWAPFFKVLNQEVQ